MHLGIIKITYNRTAQPRCYHNAFYGRPFCEPRRGGNSDFAMTIWCFWISDCFVISLSICYWLFKCRVLRCVWEREAHHSVERERSRERSRSRSQHRVCERGRQGHTTAACLQTHTSRGAVRGGRVRTILRAHDGRGPPREKRDFYRGER